MGNCCGGEDTQTQPASRPKAQEAETEENGFFPEEVEEEPAGPLEEDPLGNEAMEAAWTLVQEVIEKGEKWTDPDFPPALSSLINKRHDSGNLTKMRQVEWKRPEDIFEEPAIFKDGTSPDDIEQGGLGDCYYLACLSSMAESEENIQARFVTKEINAAGIYLLSFYINGRKTPVVVDDWIPCRSQNWGPLKPCFARSVEGELWVCLMEKAWAKLYGTYARMEGGDPAFAAQHLNGSPAKTIWHQELQGEEAIEKFFNMLKYADERNYTLMSGSHGQGEQQLADGVISGHAYSLISIHEIEHEAQPVRLLKMRNPWGQKEWTGAWSDNSTLWTDELREELGASAEDDGVFFIPYEDYVRHFATTSICVNADPEKYHHSYAVYDFGANDTHKKSFSFELTEAVPANEVFTISVAQQGPRLKRERLRQDRFVPAAIKILLYHEGGDRWIEGQYMKAFNNWMEVDDCDLEPGTYKVTVEVPQWPQCCHSRPAYKQICLDIFCTQEDVNLQPLEDEAEE